MDPDIGGQVTGGVVGAVFGGGFSVWYGWYVTTKLIPRLVDDFREDLATERNGREEDRKLISEMIRSQSEDRKMQSAIVSSVKSLITEIKTERSERGATP